MTRLKFSSFWYAFPYYVELNNAKAFLETYFYFYCKKSRNPKQNEDRKKMIEGVYL